MTIFHNAKIICKDANPSDYHKNVERGNPSFVMSSHQLANFSTNPARWLKGFSPKDSDSKIFGRLLDCMVLTPQDFPKRYTVKPLYYTDKDGKEKKWNGNATVCREWMEAQTDKEIISAYDLEEVGAAMKSIREDEAARVFIDQSDRQVWMEAEYRDKATGLIIKVKILIDIFPWTASPFAECIGDLKSGTFAAPRFWHKPTFNYNWHKQAALYVDVAKAACPDRRFEDFRHIIVENYEPFTVEKVILSAEFLNVGRVAYQSALQRYAQCLATNDWPGYMPTDRHWEGWSIVEPEPWMLVQTDIPEIQEPTEQTVNRSAFITDGGQLSELAS